MVHEPKRIYLHGLPSAGAEGGARLVIKTTDLPAGIDNSTQTAGDGHLVVTYGRIVDRHHFTFEHGG
jgi:hypothetical protein